MLVLLLGGCSIGPAPELPSGRPQVDFPVQDQRLDFTPASALEAFASAPPTTYNIGAGDRLTISVWSRPELSGKHVVGPDGFVTLPVAGLVKVSGLNREESHRAVTEAFGRFYESPIVTITIDEYTSNSLLVLGRVSKPGVIPFIRPPKLLDAIALAGGLPVGGAGSEKAALTRCAVFRGRDRVVWINLKELLAGRDLRLNLQLLAGDLVYIPDADDQLVYALGQVNSPGAYHLSPEMTLLDVIARAGGLTDRADSSRITLVRPSAGGSMTVSLRQLLRPEPGLNVSLAQGDVLYIPMSRLGRVGYIMQQIDPLTSFVIFSQTVSSGGSN
jgi:polysaccharide export outer membrane protein